MTHYLSKILVIIFLFTTSLVFAQGEAIQMKHEAGFSGFYRAGAWTPVFVTISNPTNNDGTIDGLEDFVGQLVINSNPLDGPSLRFTRQIDIPVGSEKRYVIMAKFHDYRQDLVSNIRYDLLLTLPNGRVLQTQTMDLKPLPEDRLLAVQLGSDLRGANFPRFIGSPEPGILTARLAPEDLPDHWAAWQGVDIVTLDGWPDAGLSQGQVQALRHWVQSGGTLVMLGGQQTQSYRGDLPESLLPVRLDGTTYLRKDAEVFYLTDKAPEDRGASSPAYITSRATAKPGAHTLLALGNSPLFVEQSLGKGTLAFFANDLRSSSVDLERLLYPAWQAVAPSRNLASFDYQEPGTLLKFKALTGSAAKPPNLFVVVLISLAYLVAVGPLNFGILNKKKKLEWAWVTLPVIVFSFFFLTYGIGRFIKGDVSLIRRLDVIEVPSGQREGFSKSIINSFVTSSGNHFIRPVREHTALADASQWNMKPRFYDNMFGAVGGALSQGLSADGGVGGGIPILDFDGGKNQIYSPSWPMGTFDARVFKEEGPITMDGVVETAIVWDGRMLRGSVMNNTGQDFSHAWLVVGTKFMPLGSLPNGESYDLGDGVVLPGYGPKFPTPFKEANQVLTGLVESNNVELGHEVAIFNSTLLLQEAHRPEFTGELFPPVEAPFRFIGLVSESESISQTITSTDPDIVTEAKLITVPLEVALSSSGTMIVPSDLIRLRLLNIGSVDIPTAASITPYFGGDKRMGLLNSYVVLSAELPICDPRLKVSHITVAMRGETDPSQKQELALLRMGSSAEWGIVLSDAISNRPERRIVNNAFSQPINGRTYVRVTSIPTDETGNMMRRDTKISDIALTFEVFLDESGE